MTQLNPHILPLVTGLIFLLMACAMMLLRHSSSNDRSAEYWALGNLLVAIGISLIALRGLIPLFLSLPVANLILLLGLVCLLAGVCVFFEKPVPWRALSAVAVGQFLLFVIYTHVIPDSGSRIVIGSLFIALLCGWTAVVLAREFDRALGSPQIVVSFMFFTMSLFMVVRAFLSRNDQSPSDIMLSSPIHTAAFVLGMVTVILVTFGFTVMINRRLYNRLEYLASHDPLTGAHTRRVFEEEVERELSRCRRQDDAFSVLLLDLDHFKKTNDAHGHIAGDKVLKGVTEIMRKVLRKEDMLARIGGEEFCAILPNADSAAAREVAERMRKSISDLVIEYKGKGIGVTVSIGITTADDAAPDWEAVFHKVDQALYRAKENGRDRVEC